MEPQTELGDLVKQLVATTDNKKRLQVQVKEMTTREKALKAMIKEQMKTREIDVLKLAQGGKVSRTQRTSKGGMTKDVVKSVLMDYFENDSETVDRIMTRIEEKRGKKSSESLTVRLAK